MDTTDTTEHLVDCVALDTGDTLTVVDPREILVYVAQGRAWITEEALADDIVRDAAGWYRLTRAGTAVVEALAPAVLVLTSPHERGFAKAMLVTPRPRRPAAARQDAPAGPSRGGQVLVLPTAATR